MPKPAAEFSALAITRSMRWKSTMPARPRRTRSRPGLPTISPMKRIRTVTAYSVRLSADRDRDGAVAAVGKLRNRDAQLAFDEARARLRRVARASEPDDPREAAVAALNEMKAGLAPGSPRDFFTGDQHRIALADDPHGGGINPWEIDGDLERVVGLVHVERRGAFAGE